MGLTPAIRVEEEVWVDGVHVCTLEPSHAVTNPASPYAHGDRDAELIAAYEARYERVKNETPPDRPLSWWRERNEYGMTHEEVLMSLRSMLKDLEATCSD